MKKRRVFAALNLPQDIKKRLIKYQRDWPALPAKWVPEQNLHITLVFIGYIYDDEMFKVCQISKEVARNHEAIEVNLNRICLAPPGKNPRMVWVMGQKNSKMTSLKQDLERRIFESPEITYRETDNRPFSPHITLARLDQKGWRQLENKPEIDKEINLSFHIDSMEIMQSDLSRSGPEYTVLESVSFKE
jgi:2'-5' RNA ligase